MTAEYMKTVEWQRRVWAWMQLNEAFDNACRSIESLQERDCWQNLGYI